MYNSLFSLFATMLSERQQYVEYNGYRYKPYVWYSGVTQESNPGAALFVIHINNILSCFNCCLFVYRDDLKIVKTVSCKAECKLLQDLNKFGYMCMENRLSINESRCKLLRFSRIYTQFKDLDVVIDSHILFVPDIEYRYL